MKTKTFTFAYKYNHDKKDIKEYTLPRKFKIGTIEFLIVNIPCSITGGKQLGILYDDVLIFKDMLISKRVEMIEFFTTNFIEHSNLIELNRFVSQVKKMPLIKFN